MTIFYKIKCHMPKWQSNHQNQLFWKCLYGSFIFYKIEIL